MGVALPARRYQITDPFLVGPTNDHRTVDYTVQQHRVLLQRRCDRDGVFLPPPLFFY